MAKIFVSFTIVSTGNWFLIAREDGAPLAEVYRSPVLLPPHTQRNQTIPNLNPVMHRVELWTTIDGVNPDQLRGRCDIDASQTSSVAFEPLPFIVGRGFGAPYYDPAGDPNDQYDNPDLVDKDYLVFKPGFGPLHWGVHIEKIVTGGFKFINGWVFADGEEFTLMISNIVTSTATSSGSGYPDGVVAVTANIDLSPTHYKKLLEVQAFTNLQINIPDIDAIPENTVFGINTHYLPDDPDAPTFHYCLLQLPAGAYCMIAGVQRNVVPIGRGEEVSFIKKGAYLRLVSWDGDYRRVGEKVYADSVRPVNGLPLLGGWFSKDLYYRIYWWHVANIPIGEQGTGYTDNQNPDAVNRVKWIDGNVMFWAPDHGGYFTRAHAVDDIVDPNGSTRAINSIQVSENKSHNHVVAPWNRSASRASESGGSGTPSGQDSTNPTTEYRVASMTDGMWGDATINASGGPEARPINLSEPKYVII